MGRHLKRSTCPRSRVDAEFDPFHVSQLSDPYVFYSHARREEPVFFNSMLRTWYVTRYDDIVTVLNDPARFSMVDALETPFDYTPGTVDMTRKRLISRNTQEEHSAASCSLYPLKRISQTWIRRAVTRFFAARQIGDLDLRVRRIADDLVERFADRGQAEFVSEFASPLPIRVILNVLGAREDDDSLQLKRWADDWLALSTGQLTVEAHAQATERLVEAQQYWLTLIEARRRCPCPDLLSSLITASQEDEGSVSPLQVLNACWVLALAGYETTANLLSICLYRLLTIPEQWRLVCEDRANVPKAIEETLRADTPVHALMRITTEPVDLGGVRIPRGERLAVLFASANHDEKYFHDPLRFDLCRKGASRHIAFGRGVHSCLGARLARLEGRIALELLIDRLPGLRLARVGEIAFVANPIHRGLKELRIAWDI